MTKLLAAIKKDFLVLLRDKTGLALMFLMPVLLVIIVTAIQNNTFGLLQKKQISLFVCNNDTGHTGLEYLNSLDSIGIFDLNNIHPHDEKNFTGYLQRHNATIGIFIPENFSYLVNTNAAATSSKALSSFGLQGDSVANRSDNSNAIVFYYNPEMQESFKLSVRTALSTALQMIESKQVLRTMYQSVNEKELPDSLAREMMQNNLHMSEVSLAFEKQQELPNATQHNVPAWTIFAMFFVILSLGGSVVREKTSGSFIRLKTMPTNFYVALLSKQMVFLLATLLQAMIIFAIGMYIFPLIHLPELYLPKAFFTLLLVTVLCGWCAVSYAICVGMFAATQEQVNGFGAISIVIFAIIGGLMVPAFAMPASLKYIMGISPLHWCLEAYYTLFLKGGKLKDVLINIVPIFAMIIVLQLLIAYRLKRKKLL